MEMAIKSVELAALPKRTRELTDEDRALGAAIVKAASGDKYATDGEAHKTRAEANAVASKMKRLVAALNLVPAGKVVTTATRPQDDGFAWFLSFKDAPAEPRKRNRKAAAQS